MKPICIIPARGGSKRLQRKNILPILGRPMMQYPIKTAIRSCLFEDVIVSTEDQEIAQIAATTDARAIKRPYNYATDESTVVQVCLHVLDVLENENKCPEHFCCIYSTAIFLKPYDLYKSYAMLKDKLKCNYVMGVSKYNLNPVQALIEKDDFLQPMWPEYQDIKSQFYPHLVASNGTLYWAKVSAFRNVKSFYGNRLRGYVIPRNRAIDIDTHEDYERAKNQAKRFFNSK